MNFKLTLTESDFTAEELAILKSQALKEGLSLKDFVAKITIEEIRRIQESSKTKEAV